MDKKFLFVIDSLGTGGAQRQMVNLALGLTQCGYQVEFFCYQPGDLLAQPLYDAGIPVHWHYKSSRFSLNVVQALSRLIDEGQFGLVLSFLTTPNFYSILAGRILQRHPIPVVVSERRCDLPTGATRLERFSRQFYRLASCVVTNSHHQCITLQKNYPWLKNRLSTIYNGYDLDAFRPSMEVQDHYPLRILAIASVVPHKNGICLVEALHILKERDGLLPRVDWIGRLVKEGIRLEYLNKMEQLIAQYRLKDQWQWMEQRTDIAHQLHDHDVLVHASYGEGLPNVVCEAFACGRPAIVSDTLDHARLVQPGKNGYLFNHEDPTDLADKIKRFIHLSTDERRAMGLCGRDFAEANLSLERYTGEYECLLTSLLA